MKIKTDNNVKELLWNIIGICGKILIDCLFLTTRIDKKGSEKVEHIIHSGRYILAVWHSRILLVDYLFKHVDGVAMVSSSKDGEIAARILQRQGNKAVRGSTNKGSVRALSGFIKKLNDRSRPAIIVADGPKGPVYKVKPGIIFLSKKTRYPIVPISYSAKRIKVFSSWDHFILPYPFTKCKVVYGDPVFVPENIKKDEICCYANKLEDELCEITNSVDQYFNHKI